jgi:hypothetical protein
MGEEFYAIIKLVSGEEIMSLVMVDENDGDSVIVLQNPITMKMVTNSQGTYIKVKPWIEMSSDDFFIIKLDKIITMTETKDTRMINLYNEYILSDGIDQDINENDRQVKPSKKMGYITTVEDARKSLEKIFNSNDI